MQKRTERRGAPKQAPTRITVTVHDPYAQRLQELAIEAGVTTSAYCAHVLERWATQDMQILANDIVVTRLSAEVDKQLAKFIHRLGEVMLRDLHETVALRHMLTRQIARGTSLEEAHKLQQASWTQAVEDLRDQVRRVRGHHED